VGRDRAPTGRVALRARRHRVLLTVGPATCSKPRPRRCLESMAPDSWEATYLPANGRGTTFYERSATEDGQGEVATIDQAAEGCRAEERHQTAVREGSEGSLGRHADWDRRSPERGQATTARQGRRGPAGRLLQEGHLLGRGQGRLRSR